MCDSCGCQEPWTHGDIVQSAEQERDRERARWLAAIEEMIEQALRESVAADGVDRDAHKIALVAKVTLEELKEKMKPKPERSE